MSAHSIRKSRIAGSLAATSVAVLAVFGLAAPAQALVVPGNPPSVPSAVEKVAYAALGDSYAAGFGGGDYGTTDPCAQSPNGYAALLASDPGNVHVALRGCTGADTTDIASQLAGLDHRTKLVTLTVGANDLGLAEVTAACLPGPSEACSIAIGTAVQIAQTVLPGRLAEVLADIRAAAPKAHVVVTGYPLLLDPQVPNSETINAGTIMLNGVIAAAVAAAGDGFTYVDVVPAFAGHGIGSLAPWIVSPPQFDAFHPNPAGHAAYADAIRAVR
ncbi:MULTISPECIES: SGNH/GDSL hydrolase family protein [unclassified Agromyces]|uniref:SGNH/GDSL hydrolase family protein n=1 Tax=unclassified Agromyces TaxID=2639701 RepID=UPI0030153C6C